MQTYIALLRGINVGGNNLLPMAELRKMLTEMGFENPKTMLQSGNAVFRSLATDPNDLEASLRDETKKRFGFGPEYFLRTASEWRDLVDGNPFRQEAEEDPGHLLAILLKDPADPEHVERVQAAVKGAERIHAHGRQLYVVFPDGVGRSKLHATPGWPKLGGIGTGRNWNTVRKLADLASELEG